MDIQFSVTRRKIPLDTFWLDEAELKMDEIRFGAAVKTTGEHLAKLHHAVRELMDVDVRNEKRSPPRWLFHMEEAVVHSGAAIRQLGDHETADRAHDALVQLSATLEHSEGDTLKVGTMEAVDFLNGLVDATALLVSLTAVNRPVLGYGQFTSITQDARDCAECLSRGVDKAVRGWRRRKK